MSEVNLNLIDAHSILQGRIHGSIADAAVAALSAEPATIAELDNALTRYIKPITPDSMFVSFHTSSKVDGAPCDAGVVIIDLAARIVAAESTYSMPGPEGEVRYHDGTQATEVAVLYRVPADWIFVYSLEEYYAVCERRRQERAATPPVDVRAVLYGRPLIEWIVNATRQSDPPAGCDESTLQEQIHRQAAAIHASWLMTPRGDLRHQSPRDVVLAKLEFIDFDLHTREMQWSLLGEGPPCLSIDSLAYRFAGFGTHEYVIYYDLVRHLICTALSLQRILKPDGVQAEVARLESIKSSWLEQPQRDLDGRIPAVIIENERKRLPQALNPRDMIIDDDCPMCQMLGDESALGLGVGFWHLDGAHMDDDFAFSFVRTREEFEIEERERQAFFEKFNRDWEERQQRIARGELDPGVGLVFDEVSDSDVIRSDS